MQIAQASGAAGNLRLPFCAEEANSQNSGYSLTTAAQAPMQIAQVFGRGGQRAPAMLR
jgi:hypothetical protein